MGPRSSRGPKWMDGWLRLQGGALVTQEYWRVLTGVFWTFGERLCPLVQVGRDEPHQLSCLVLRKPS
jgi:hypothetical protein